ncbi:MAG: His/Gly/Thr/Pro-type tRNA ligase C-terminal domain-containing protein, partial [Candidatus Bathyarchaeia archaeon]
HAWRTDYDLKMHMVHSGTDLRAFTLYDKPRKAKKLHVKVQLDKIKQTFSDDAQLINMLLQSTDPALLKQTLEREGRFPLRSNGTTYDVLAEHVRFEEVEEEETGRRFIPHVVEPSFGSDRILYAVLENSYTEKEERIILRIPHTVTPVEVAVFPLVSKNELIHVATALRGRLIEDGFTVEYDASGSIGRRYARADEIGVAIALTVDYQSLEDNTVTARDRDTWAQVRVNTATLSERLRGYLHDRVAFAELGTAVPTRKP